MYDMPKSSCVNARLDARSTARVAYLLRETKANTSEVLRKAIEIYYNQVCKAHQNTADVLNQAGFVGCAEGQSDFSETYKFKERRPFENLMI